MFTLVYKCFECEVTGLFSCGLRVLLDPAVECLSSLFKNKGGTRRAVIALQMAPQINMRHLTLR